MTLIPTIEELSINAWPAAQTLLYDGWVLRLAGGYTKRANSVYPLYSSSLDLEQKIEFCEGVYQDQGLAVVFKMTRSAHPENLDQILAGRGYQRDSDTSVQILDLAGVDAGLDRETVLAKTLSEGWLSDFCRLGGVNEPHRSILKGILSRIALPRCFVSLRRGGRTVACGLGVRQGVYLGLFDIITDPQFRNQGYGRRLVEAILAWGKGNGAGCAYLQVMLDNRAALHLYGGLGFQEAYRYWYRIKTSSTARTGPIIRSG